MNIGMIFNHKFSWKYLIFSTVALFLYACGSSSSQEDEKNTVVPTLNPTAFTLNPIAQGKVVDGYISGATVFINQNFNLSQDEGEIWTISSESGEFLLDGVIDKLLELELIQAADSGGSTDILFEDNFESYALDASNLSPWKAYVSNNELQEDGSYTNLSGYEVNPAPNDPQNISGIFTEEVGEGQGEKYIKFQSNYADEGHDIEGRMIRTTLYQAFEILPEMNGNYRFSFQAKKPNESPLNSDGSTARAFIFIRNADNAIVYWNDLILTDTSNDSWQDFELDMDIYGPSLEGFEVVYGFQNQVIGKADSALILDNVKVDAVSSFNADYIYSNNAAIDEVDNLYRCWRNRPLVASVPVGANDSTTGTVVEAYEMILPSVNDSRIEELVISPFSTFLAEAVLNGISKADLKEELTLEEGCGNSLSDAIERNIREEIESIEQEIENLFGISYSDLVHDFLTGETNDIITEEKAQIIASWLPKLRVIRNEIAAEMFETFGQNVNPYFVMSEESRNNFFNNEEVEGISIEFLANYVGPRNNDGWYYDQRFESEGAKIDLLDNIIPFKCAEGSESCLIEGFSLDSIYNSAYRHTELINFRNDEGVPGHEDKDLDIFVEKQSRWQGTLGGLELGDSYEDLERFCIFSEEIRSNLEMGLPDRVNASFRNNMGENYTQTKLLDCNQAQNNINGKVYNLFFWYDANTNAGDERETYDVQFVSDRIEYAQYIENKIIDPFTNRENLDPKPFLDEIDAMPKTFAQLNEIREMTQEWTIPEEQPHRETVNFNFTKQSNEVGSFSALTSNIFHFRMHWHDPEKDEFHEINKDNNNVIESSIKYGQEARTAFFDVLKSSEQLYINELAGSVAP